LGKKKKKKMVNTGERKRYGWQHLIGLGGSGRAREDEKRGGAEKGGPPDGHRIASRIKPRGRAGMGPGGGGRKERKDPSELAQKKRETRKEKPIKKKVSRWREKKIDVKKRNKTPGGGGGKKRHL